MLSRFLSNLTVLLLSATLVALTLALAPTVTAWLGLAVGAVTVMVTAGAFLARDRGAVQRALDGPVAILGGWTMVQARVFAGSTVRWVTLGDAVALAVLAAVGLIAHEVLSERAIHRMFGDSRTAGAIVVNRRPVALPDSSRT